jgi:molybdate transport system regulatory protein
MEKKYCVDGHIAIKSKNSTLLGSEKMELIEKIKQLGSLQKAAQEMNIAYRQAWKKIQELNKFSSKPLVILSRGGINGGYAEVTKHGDTVLLNYKDLKVAFDKFLKDQTKKLEI